MTQTDRKEEALTEAHGQRLSARHLKRLHYHHWPSKCLPKVECVINASVNVGKMNLSGGRLTHCLALLSLTHPSLLHYSYGNSGLLLWSALSSNQSVDCKKYCIFLVISSQYKIIHFNHLWNILMLWNGRWLDSKCDNILVLEQRSFDSTFTLYCENKGQFTQIQYIQLKKQTFSHVAFEKSVSEFFLHLNIISVSVILLVVHLNVLHSTGTQVFRSYCWIRQVALDWHSTTLHLVSFCLLGRDNFHLYSFYW